MEIRAIDHVQLAMPAGGEAAARAFYASVLGLTEIPKPPHLAARGGCWFENGAVKIHLGVDSGFRPARKAHPGLLVEGLTDLVARLEAGGFPVGRDAPIFGYDRVYAYDPFGNRIELMESRPAGSVMKTE
jgi:catechol 2,3-dioxygenase-like lactoylglutathione lyase family enzyme